MLLELANNKAPAATKTSNGNVIGIIGAKGGVGATTVALNLATSLASALLEDKRVTLLDGNLQQSDLVTMTAQQPAYNIADIFNREGELEESVFWACTYELGHAKHSPHIVSPSVNIETAVSYDLASLVECMPQIAKFSDLVLMDLPKHLDQSLVSLLDQCKYILLVFEPTLIGIGAARRWLTCFEDLEYSTDKILLVVNRSGGKIKDVEQKLENCFANRRLFYLPNAFSQLQHANLTGTPLVLESERHAYSQAIKKMADFILASTEKKNV